MHQRYLNQLFVVDISGDACFVRDPRMGNGLDLLFGLSSSFIVVRVASSICAFVLSNAYLWLRCLVHVSNNHLEGLIQLDALNQVKPSQGLVCVLIAKCPRS